MKILDININTKEHRITLFSFSVLFFIWGLLTVMNYVVKEHLKVLFGLSYSFIMLLNYFFFSSYLLLSSLAGKIIRKYSYKRTIISGWLLATLGCFFFVYAVITVDYRILYVSLTVMAGGITFLQVAANLYVVLMGSDRYAASRLTFVQAFNSVGTFLAPLFTGGVLMYMTDIPDVFRSILPEKYILTVDSVHLFYPYALVGFVMLLYTAYLLYAKIPDIDMSSVEPLNKVTSLRKRHAMHFSQLRLGAFAIFAYVGAEVALGNYLQDFSPEKTKFYWGAAMAGRFIGSYLLLKFDTRKLVGIYALMACTLVVLSIFVPREIAFWIIVCVGLFNSILFPSIFCLGVNGLGKFSVSGSSVLIMFIIGGAVIPFVVGNFSYVSIKAAFIIPVLCYLYISLYGFKLSKYEVQENVKAS
ncbi:MAG: MFS transporter [Cytophagaceae bacterium]|nr:MFS transporter [Cytophagaceae bacterium]MDW8456762.1 MFS transporter [Cytophagaceae bacterium]